jgi:threonine synthase
LIAGAEKTATYMEDLKINGKYTVDANILDKISETFVGYCADEKATAETIRKTYNNYSYLSDTHTAVALNCAEQYIDEASDNKIIVVASTASPYKFAGDVYSSLTGKSPSGNLEALDELNTITNVEIPLPFRNIGSRTVLFETTIEKNDMKDYVKNTL